MYLHSTKPSIASDATAFAKPNQSQQNRTQEAAGKMEDLYLLEQLCREHLRAEIPSGEFFLVKCAVKDNLLMILTEHPKGVNVSTEDTFTVLEELLYSEFTPSQSRVELFLRYFGTKLPYIKRCIKINFNNQVDNQEVKTVKITGSCSTSVNSNSLSGTSIVPLSSGVTDNQNHLDTSESFSIYNSTSTSTSTSEKKFPRKGALAAVIFSVVAIFGTAGNVLMSPCTFNECRELETALLGEGILKARINNIKSVPELLAVQQKIDLNKTSLQKIPQWSPYHSQAVEVIENLSEQSNEINQVLKAFKNGKKVAQLSRTPSESIEELQAKQKLWRQAIAPLESISTNSELYTLVKPKLFNYSTNLKIINRQLLGEKKWLKKLNDSKSVAKVAKKRTEKAVSLEDWQKAQSTWQIAVNALKVVPRGSIAYADAQKILSEYIPELSTTRQRTTKEMIAVKSYELSLLAAKEAEKYAQIDQWSLSISHWNQALNAAKSIPKESKYYQQVESQIKTYSLKLKQAQQNLKIVQRWQKIGNDLEKTCYGEIEICKYTLDNKGIIVRITSEYEKALEKSFVDASIEEDPQAIASVNGHLQILQQALEAISNNADLPLLVYDSQGEIIQKTRFVL
ncbi:MAG: hypothetical protein AAF378_02400 [Cyanobacteria bacterium P01_A01_bin.84]